MEGSLEFREEIKKVNPWVQLVSRFTEESPQPYVHLRTQDYVAIIAMNRNRLALVKQFRIALNIETIELPSGLIETGQSSIAAAWKELEEEVGLIPTSDPIPLPVQFVDSARLETRVYPFFFETTEEKADWVEEPGITRVWIEQGNILATLRSGMLSLSSHSGMLAYLKMSGVI